MVVDLATSTRCPEPGGSTVAVKVWPYSSIAVLLAKQILAVKREQVDISARFADTRDEALVGYGQTAVGLRSFEQGPR